MSEWRDARLGDVTTKIGSGATPRGGKNSYIDNGIAFIRSQNVYDGYFSFDGLANITDEAADKLRVVTVESGDVLINITGESVTRAALVPDSALPARVSQHVAIVRPDQRYLDPTFLLATLLSPPTKAHLNLLSSAGATRRALTKAHLEQTRIKLPSLEEQRRIASVLGAFDDLIETNRDLASRAAHLARSIAATASTCVPFSDITTASVSKQIRPEGPVSHYSLPAFDEDQVPEHVDGESIKSNKLPLTSPTVLVSRLNPKWERCWMVYPGENSVSSTEFVPFVGYEVATEEVWAVASASNFWKQMRSRVTGTTGSHQRVSKEAIATLVVPDVRLLAEDKRLQIIDLVRLVQDCRDEIADLTRTRDELLPLLMSGKVRVDDVEISKGAV